MMISLAGEHYLKAFVMKFSHVGHYRVCSVVTFLLSWPCDGSIAYVSLLTDLGLYPLLHEKLSLF